MYIIYEQNDYLQRNETQAGLKRINYLKHERLSRDIWALILTAMIVFSLKKGLA